MSAAQETAAIERVCVFCGSSSGAAPEYAEAARGLGRALARRGLGLVYGGANVGLMAELADATLDAGGPVVGVIPQALVEAEVAHTRLVDLQVVGSMHERKARMVELADAFIALPGGMGTLEELFEVLTWAQLGFHHKPCGLLDVRSYYRPLLDFLDHAVRERFLKPKHRARLLVAQTPDDLLDQFARYESSSEPRQLDGRTR